VDAGVARDTANHRAAFLYWAFLGQAAIVDRRWSSLPASAIADIATLFES
jgi:hypothetical protein